MSKSFGTFLRRTRKRKKLTQRALASEVGINFTYLSKVENDVPGFSSLSAPTLEKLADALDVDPDKMITRAGKIPSDVRQVLVDDFSLVKEIRDRKKINDGSTGGSQ